MVEIYFLPLNEASDAARSQMSGEGKIAVIASRRMLLLDDDSTHLQKAIALLKRLDHPPGQYTAYLSIEDVRSDKISAVQASARTRLGHLAGGWMQVGIQHQSYSNRQHQSFQLRISAAKAGSLETGSIHAFNRATKQWLSGYGVVRANSVELVPITSGFHISVQPAGRDQLRVHIVPWMQRMDKQVQGQHELLFGLGSSNHPTTPPSNVANMRLNARPNMQDQPVIEITGAATDLVIPVDQSVTIAAVNQEAERFGSALLSGQSHVGKRQFVIHLRVSKSQ